MLSVRFSFGQGESLHHSAATHTGRKMMLRGPCQRLSFREQLLYGVTFHVSLPKSLRNFSYARCAFCLTAPTLDRVARATSSRLRPETFNSKMTSRWDSGSVFNRSAKLGEFAICVSAAALSGNCSLCIS